MEKFRKSIKNYTTSIPAGRILENIQRILVQFEAQNSYFTYDGQGRIEAIAFKIVINDVLQGVLLPVEWVKVRALLEQIGGYKDDEHAYRVALKNLQDWLDAQFAILQTQMVEFPQIFLPYMVNSDGKTLYSVLKESNYKLLSS